MKRPLTEEFVRNRVLEWLSSHGYSATKVKTLSEHGPDILAKKIGSNRFYIVEVKGDVHTERNSLHHGVLLSALGEIMLRVQEQKYCKYAVGIPESYREMVIRRVQWILMKKMGLDFLFVNTKGEVEKLNWPKLKNMQFRQ